MSVSNEELASGFRALVSEDRTKTYLDRFIDLAVYINESTKESSEKEDLLDDLQVMMTRTYGLEETE